MEKYNTDFNKLSMVLIPESREDFISACAEMITTKGRWDGNVFYHNKKLTKIEQGMIVGARDMMSRFEEVLYL